MIPRNSTGHRRASPPTRTCCNVQTSTSHTSHLHQRRLSYCFSSILDFIIFVRRACGHGGTQRHGRVPHQTSSTTRNTTSTTSSTHVACPSRLLLHDFQRT